MKRHTLNLMLVFGICLLNAGITCAQQIHFNQFDATPLSLNPALSGKIDGDIRANMNYRNQWTSTTVPFISFQASADAPVYRLRSGDYWGGGIQVGNSVAGDGNLRNLTGLLSGSFHKQLSRDSAWKDGRGSEIAIGVQAGYAQSNINVSGLYFTDTTHTAVTTTTQVSLNYYIINAGLTFTQSLSDRFNYTVGLSVNNFNQPNNALEKKNTSAVGFDLKSIAIAGCNIQTGKRLMLRPALIFDSQSGRNNIIAGNEFSYNAGNVANHTFLFCGVWYRTQDVIMATAGMSVRRFRVGISYDYNVSTVNAATNGSGGVELAISYVGAGAKNAHRQIPSSRF